MNQCAPSQGDKSAWCSVMMLNDLFDLIMSFSKFEDIVCTCDVVCKSWNHRISSEQEEETSLWLFLLPNIFEYLNGLISTCNVYSETDFESSSNLYIFTRKDFGIREQVRIDLLNQIHLVIRKPGDIKSKRHALLIITNYLYSIRKCSIIYCDNSETLKYYLDPMWIKVNDLHCKVPSFLQSKTERFWIELCHPAWFSNQRELFNVGLVLLSKYNNVITTLVHHPSSGKSTKAVDQRKEWSFVSSKKRYTELESSESDEEGITDVWATIKKRKAQKQANKLLCKYEGRCKLLWIPAKVFRERTGSSFFDTMTTSSLSTLEEAPKRGIKALNALLCGWIFELQARNLLHIDFVLFNMFRLLFFIHRGLVEDPTLGLLFERASNEKHSTIFKIDDGSTCFVVKAKFGRHSFLLGLKIVGSHYEYWEYQLH